MSRDFATSGSQLARRNSRSCRAESIAERFPRRGLNQAIKLGRGAARLFKQRRIQQECAAVGERPERVRSRARGWPGAQLTHITPPGSRLEGKARPRRHPSVQIEVAPEGVQVFLLPLHPPGELLEELDAKDMLMVYSGAQAATGEQDARAQPPRQVRLDHSHGGQQRFPADAGHQVAETRHVRGQGVAAVARRVVADKAGRQPSAP